MAEMKAVLEFGTSKIICMVDCSGLKGVDIPLSSCVRYEGILKGDWINRNNLATYIEQAISSTENKCNRQLRNIYVGVPADFTRIVVNEITHEVPTGVVTKEVIKRMMDAARPKDMIGSYTLVDARPVFFTTSSDELYVDRPIGVRTLQLKAMFSYYLAKKDFVTDVASVLAGMHIGVEGFVSEAGEQAIAYIPFEKRAATAVLIDAGFTQTAVSLIFNDVVLASEVIPIGGETFTNELMKELSATPHVCENLKRNHVFGLSVTRGTKEVYGKTEDGRMMSYDQNVVRDVMEDVMYKFAGELEKVLDRFYHRKLLSRHADFYLSGAGMAMKGTDVFLQNMLKHNVVRIKNTAHQTMSPVYTTVLALLDNDLNRDYDLCGGVYRGQNRSKFGVFNK